MRENVNRKRAYIVDTFKKAALEIETIAEQTIYTIYTEGLDHLRLIFKDWVLIWRLEYQQQQQQQQQVF